MTDSIAELARLLLGRGEFLNGYTGEIEDAISHAVETAPDKPFCLVRNWRIIEVLVSVEYAEALAKDGLSPHVVYAETVVMHSTGKRAVGQWVRSTFQRSFTRGFLFETQNTVYALLGEGTKVQGSARAVLAITGQL